MAMKGWFVRKATLVLQHAGDRTNSMLEFWMFDIDM
jgi:hypothetical protein